MSRRKEGLLDEIASLPWPFGLVLGVVAFAVVGQFGGGVLVPLAWVFMAACWAAAGASFLKARQRKSLLETRTGLESLSRISWREFEMLVGEAFRRQGYSVEETGLGGKDGGIDLILRRGGRTELVQCKQWRTRQIKVPVVREMWGLVAHHTADGVKIVCVGDFTRDAAQFAQGKAIELINGERLLELVRKVQTTHKTERIDTPLAASERDVSEVANCPYCGMSMVKRTNRKTRQSFLGCANYPRCKGTRVA